MLVERLGENPWTKDDDIRVDVKRNVAILTGEVSTSVAKGQLATMRGIHPVS
jgi:hypothetical protein